VIGIISDQRARTNSLSLALPHLVPRAVAGIIPSVAPPRRPRTDRARMPQDPVQIALEHHRAGRLVTAEAGYRSALAADPGHPEALHWLGVLLTQAGRPAEAVPLLARAADLRPDDPAFRQNLGQASLAAGDTTAAVAALERANGMSRDRPETAAALAQAYLVRRSPGDAALAAAALRRTIAAGHDAPQLHHNLGVALLAAGQPADAEASLRAALASKPDYVSAHYHLAQALVSRGKPKDARKHLTKALELDPAHARAWYALAALDVDAGNAVIAAGLYRKAIKLRPDYAAAYHGLGFALARAGRRDEALATLAQADRVAKAAKEVPGRDVPRPRSVAELQASLTPDETQAQLHQALAGLMNLPPPSQIAAEEVSNLFDRYAYRFDAHLQETLGYKVPAMLVPAIAPHLPGGRGPDVAAAPGTLDVIDLGCGTGLCGPHLRPLARTLAGVDLSAAMLDKARARGSYDRLEQADLVAALRAMPRGADLLVAADALIYTGDLAPTFEAAAAALRPGGLLVYSAEAGDPAERYTLSTRTRRYSHGKPYLKHLAGIYGFEEKAFEEITVRTDRNAPVAGFLVVLR
jgi:predicted TPR repeat methyltransferase/thioredoxin-like negative regulator of GroEL